MDNSREDTYSELGLKYPRIGVFIFLTSAIISFFGANILYEFAENNILKGIQNDLIEIAIKMGIFFFYLIPLIIGALLTKLKNSFIQIVGLLFAGLGFGIVIKIALIFTGVLYPYRF